MDDNPTQPDNTISGLARLMSSSELFSAQQVDSHVYQEPPLEQAILAIILLLEEAAYTRHFTAGEIERLKELALLMSMIFVSDELKPEEAVEVITLH